MKNDRLDRSLHLVPLMRMRGNDVHHLRRQVVLIRHRHSRKRMSEHLSVMTLDDLPGLILIKLQRLPTVRQQSPCDQIISIDRHHLRSEHRLQHACNRQTLLHARIEMSNKSHVNIPRQQCKFHRPKFIKRPPLPSTPRRDCLIPHRRHPIAQSPIANLHQVGKEFSNIRCRVHGVFLKQMSD